MPFNIGTLADLVGRARSSFRAYLPGSDAWIWPNNVNPAAKVVGGTGWEVMQFADYIAKQKFAGTADSDNLEKHAQEFGLARRPAAPAGGDPGVTITCPDAVSVAAGAVFRRADGVEYIAQSSPSIGAAGSLDVAVIAATDGANTNANAGTPLAIVSGVTGAGAGTATAAVASGGIVGGADVEPDGDLWTTDLGTLRGRVLFRKRYPPHGGAPADYVQWATEVSGVTRVWVERLWSGPGTVRVFVLMDGLYPDGIPPVAEIQRVASYIETKRPSGAVVTVAAPTPVVVNVQIGGLVPDTTDVRNAALAELANAFARLSVVAGNDTPHGGMPFLATPASFSRSWLWQAVANATGEQRHSINLPAVDVPLTSGQMATLGSPTFVP